MYCTISFNSARGATWDTVDEIWTSAIRGGTWDRSIFQPSLRPFASHLGFIYLWIFIWHVCEHFHDKFQLKTSYYKLYICKIFYIDHAFSKFWTAIYLSFQKTSCTPKGPKRVPGQFGTVFPNHLSHTSIIQGTWDMHRFRPRPQALWHGTGRIERNGTVPWKMYPTLMSRPLT